MKSRTSKKKKHVYTSLPSSTPQKQKSHGETNSKLQEAAQKEAQDPENEREQRSR